MLSPLLALALAPLQSPTVSMVLGHVREAVGYEQLGGAFRAEGTLQSSGLEGSLRLDFTSDGKYLFEQGGRLGQTRSWDGERGWDTDTTGAPMGLHLSELQYQHAITWTIDHRWLDPDGPFTVTLAGAEPGGDSYTLNLSQKAGSLEQRLTVDKATWLPKATTFSEGYIDFEMTFSRWKRFDGVNFATRVDTKEGELKGWFKFDSFKRLDAAPSFDRPAWSLTTDAQYDPDKGGVVESKLAVTGHVLVHPRIGGKDVGWFILDSGAGGMAIDPSVAESLGAEKFGELNLGGVGGVEESAFYQLADFSLGPVTVKSLNFISVELKPISAFFGVELAGIVGYDFLRRVVAEIDVSDGRVALFDPRGYQNEGASWEALVLDGRHPTALATYEGGATGRFRIDTGANGTVTFNAPTVERGGFLTTRETTNSGLAGVGGIVAVKSGKIKFIVLGGERFEDVTSTFGLGNKGIFSEDFLAGNIGQDLLKPFRLVLDYHNERMAFVKKPPGSSARR